MSSSRRSIPRAYLAGLLAAILLPTGCGDDRPADFTYRPPEGWRVLELLETGLPFPVAAGPSARGVVPTISVERATLVGDLEAFVDLAMIDVLSSQPGYRLLARRDAPLADGRAAVRVTAEVEDGARTLRLLQLVTSDDDTAFVVTCSRAAGDDAATDAAFEAALATFVTG